MVRFPGRRPVQQESRPALTYAPGLLQLSAEQLVRLITGLLDHPATLGDPAVRHRCELLAALSAPPQVERPVRVGIETGGDLWAASGPHDDPAWFSLKAMLVSVLIDGDAPVTVCALSADEADALFFQGVRTARAFPYDPATGQTRDPGRAARG